MEKKRLKVIVAGLGRISWGYHLPQLAERSDFELLAVADPMADRCREAVEKFKVPRTYADCEEMIAREKDADLLVLTSPTCFHADQAVYALEHGVDVFCEKPLAGNLAEAERMVEAMHRNNRRMMVFQPHRVRPETETLLEILRSGLLGRVFMARRVCSNFSRRNDWQARLELGGGMLNNYGSHYIDQFMYVFGGEEFRVSGCELRRMVSAGDADDVARILLVNDAGIIGDIDINMASAIPETAWTVYGDRGMARLDTVKQCWEVRYLKEDEIPDLSLQQSMAAAGRSYASEAALPWHEREFALGEYRPGLYYDYAYAYFAQGAAPFAPIETTMKLMRINAECRRIAESHREMA